MRAFLTTEFAKFLLAGGFAALVNFLSRIVYDLFVSFSVAIVAAYITGMITAYLLTRTLVFERSDNTVSREVVWFSIVNLAAVAQTWAVSMVLYHFVLPHFLPIWQKEVAHLAGIAVPVFTSFLGHKYLTFRRTPADED